MNSAQTRVPSIVTGILLPASRRPAETPTEGTPSSPAAGRLLEGHRPSPFTPGRMSFEVTEVLKLVGYLLELRLRQFALLLVLDDDTPQEKPNQVARR